jgi:hypothetical protein
MAWQHIDDLPRHEEPRQLMFGLIDDLPQERRGTCLSLGLTVVLPAAAPARLQFAVHPSDQLF